MSNSQYNIILGTSVDTKNADKILSSYIKNNKYKNINLAVDVDTKSLTSVTKQLKEIGETASTIQTNLNNALNSNGNVERYVTSVNKLNEAMTASKEKIANVASVVNEYNASIQKLVSNNANIRTFAQNVESLLGIKASDLSLDVPIKKTSESFNKYINEAGQVITQTRTWDNELGAINTTITETTDKLGKVTIQTKTMTDSGTVLSESIKTISDTTKNLNSGLDETKAKVPQISDEYKNWQQKAKAVISANEETTAGLGSLISSIVEATGKVALFSVSTAAISAFTTTIREAKEAVFDFDEALTEYKKVSDLSGDELDEYTQKLGELGESVARTRTEMVSSATEFKKSGYTDEQSAELAQVAELYRNIADEELSSADAAGFVVSMMKAYSEEVEQLYGDDLTSWATHSVDSINNISNNMAVSSSDLSDGISKVASAFASAGNTYEESLSLISSAVEIMHNQSNKAARGLRTISANFAKAAASGSELSYTVNGASQSISLIDEETGDMKNTFEIFQDIYTNGWNEMTAVEQDNLAITYAGKNQMEVFLSVLNNFEAAQKALGLATDSTNSALNENNRYMESIEAKVNKVKTAFQNLVLGDGGLSNIIKLILDLTANVITFIDKNSNLIIALTATAVAFKAVKAVAGADGLIATFKSLAILFSTLVSTIADGSVTISEALATITTEFNLNPTLLAIEAVVVAGWALYNVLSYISEAAERSHEKLQELSEASDTATSELNDAQTQLDEINNQIAEAESLKITDEDDLNNLKAERVELEKQVELAKEKEKLAHKDEEKQAIKDSKTNQTSASYYSYSTDSTPANLYTESFTITGTASEQLEQYLAKYEEASNQIKEINAELADDSNNLSDNEINNLLTERTLIQENLDEFETKATEMAGYLQTQNDSLYSNDEETQNLRDSNNELLDSYTNLVGRISDDGTLNSWSDQLNQVIEDTQLSKESIQEYAEENIDGFSDMTEGTEEWYAAMVQAANAMTENAENIDTAASAMSNAISTISDLGSTYKNLKDAVDDYNNGGGMTATNLENLINLATEHAGALEFDGEQLKLNETYFENLANAEIDEAEAKVAEDAQTQIASINNQDFADILQQVETASNNAAIGETNAGNAAYTAGQNAAEGAKGFEKFWASVDNKDYDYDADQKKAYNYVKEQTKVQYESLEKLRGSLGTFFSDTSSASSSAGKSASSSAKSTSDAWKDAYKEAKENIDAMYENGSLTAEEYVEKLQELSDKYLTDTEAHQESYADEIRSVYNDMYKALKESAKDALDDEENRLKEAYNNIKDEGSKALKALKAKHEEEEDAVDKRIDALKDLKDKEKDAYDAQIDELKKVKEQVEDTYDAQIDALKAEREEYENQLELMKLKQEVAEATQGYQYVMGEDGRFGYQVNQEAVDTAQEELYEEELEQEYEAQLQALEDAKDAASKSYEQQINDLEDFRDAKVAEYEQQIDDLETYLDNLKDQNDKLEDELEAHYDELEEQYEKAYNDFKNYADKALEGQITVVENENSVWATRINNLANFVNQYNSILAKLGDTGSTNNSGSKSTINGTKSNGSRRISGATRASGDAYVSSDQLSVVGEDPNKEIVIGSKLNNGYLTKLSKGSGVVNATSTKTLAGLLNSLGTLGSNSLNNLNPNNTSNNSQSITIGNISLPQVKDGQDFINYLQNFSVDMTTKAFAY